jgi:3-dehydroquinate dehydratase type II
MLGIREPDKYGTENYDSLCKRIKDYCDGEGVEVEFYQSNHEGDLVDKIQMAYFDGVNGIVFNPAAYTHTSIALLDAVKAVSIPTVEVHISDVNSREDFRKVSYIRAACIATISGHGTDGYTEAMTLLSKQIEGERK